jgi:heptosyltransferase I
MITTVPPAKPVGAILETRLPNSVCILRLSAIGDVTHVVPVVLSLQQQRPGIQITWIIGKVEHKLVGDLPGVEFIVFDKKAGWRGYRELRRQLRGRRFDALLHMQVALRANLAAAVIPARVKVGYDRARSKDLHRLFINRRINATPRQHVRDCLASFLEPLGLAAAPPLWAIPLAAVDHDFARRHLDPARRSLVISPCASHALRNWRPERYAALADHAVRQHNMQVLLVGSPAQSEQVMCAAIAAAMAEPALNLCGQDTLKQLTALLSQADLLVAPDTGPAHIASAVGTDVLGLYAASNPLRSGPYRSLNWCVNRYPEALQRFTGKTVEQARWGAKAEFPGAMDLITVEDATGMLDRWIAAAGSWLAGFFCRVVLIGFLFHKAGTQGEIDILLQLGPLVVGHVHRPRQLDEARPEIPGRFLVANIVLNHPQRFIDRLQLLAQLCDGDLVRHRLIPGATQLVEFKAHIFQFGGVGDALGLDLKDSDLVQNLAKGNRDGDDVGHDVVALCLGE